MMILYLPGMWRDSSVGIPTCYGPDCPGIETRWGRGFPRPSRPALRPTQSPTHWVPGLFQRVSGRGVALTTHPHLKPRLKKEYSYSSTPQVGGEVFRSRPDRLWGPSSLLHIGYQVFSGGKVPRAWRWPPTPYNAEVKEGVELYHYAPSGPSWPVLGWILPLPLPVMWRDVIS